LLSIAAALALSWSGSLQAGKPTPAPSGQTISVEWRKDSFVPPEIRLMKEDGTAMLTVNKNPDLGRGGWPRWSPNGQMIGCYRKLLKDASGNYSDDGIMAMNANGTNEQLVISNSEFNTWNLSRPGVSNSQLNTFYVFSCWLGNGAMVVSGDAYYAPAFFGETDPSWANSGARLFVVDAMSITPLTEVKVQNGGSWADIDPHWSPALNKIVFLSDRTTVPELYAINPDGTGLQQITNFLGEGFPVSDIYGPVWSPQGDRIAVTIRNDATGYHIWVLAVDLTQATPGLGGRVTAIGKFAPQGSAGTNEDTAAWSPTGDRLVFARYKPPSGSRSGQAYQIVIADVATGAVTIPVNSTKQAVLFPDWKPAP
jgi:Tol biopolymer transport system component